MAERFTSVHKSIGPREGVSESQLAPFSGLRIESMAIPLIYDPTFWVDDDGESGTVTAEKAEIPATPIFVPGTDILDIEQGFRTGDTPLWRPVLGNIGDGDRLDFTAGTRNGILIGQRLPWSYTPCIRFTIGWEDNGELEAADLAKTIQFRARGTNLMGEYVEEVTEVFDFAAEFGTALDALIAGLQAPTSVTFYMWFRNPFQELHGIEYRATGLETQDRIGIGLVHPLRHSISAGNTLLGTLIGAGIPGKDVVGDALAPTPEHSGDDLLEATHINVVYKYNATVNGGRSAALDYGIELPFDVYGSFNQNSLISNAEVAPRSVIQGNDQAEMTVLGGSLLNMSALINKPLRVWRPVGEFALGANPTDAFDEGEFAAGDGAVPNYLQWHYVNPMYGVPGDTGAATSEYDGGRGRRLPDTTDPAGDVRTFWIRPSAGFWVNAPGSGAARDADPWPNGPVRRRKITITGAYTDPVIGAALGPYDSVLRHRPAVNSTPVSNGVDAVVAASTDNQPGGRIETFNAGSPSTTFFGWRDNYLMTLAVRTNMQAYNSNPRTGPLAPRNFIP